MEDNQGQDPNSPSNPGTERSEPVRSRWTPKPEQILILESIFNSGMVNPPKDETVRIRKLLEKFGSVGDANVFYWFQNRRSRSRRRQRQLQASLSGEQRNQQIASASSGAIQYESGSNSNPVGFASSHAFCAPPSSYILAPSSPSCSSSCGIVGDAGVEGLISISNQMGFQELGQSSGMSSVLCPSDPSNLHYQTGFITVFINGVPTEVPRGPLDLKAMCGQDVVLVHSSGVPVPTNEFGFVMQSLQHGESYYLVTIFSQPKIFLRD
ncbi:hypothetical protein K2173_025600 [Erythroxylum novogranatense]|uniref:Homeobox domain-containing protein n=1 Tax=Erythroxylum novogranatense TaxID=1862640 RepID=A0AAV8TAH4_9ROSI|nr:hypothetical protein K2173_025600 [Erythroxylum novogranatense]